MAGAAAWLCCHLALGFLHPPQPLPKVSRVHVSPSRVGVVAMRTITEESIARIIELVQLDAALIAEQMQRQGPNAAWQLAQKSFDRRWPLVEWLLSFKADQAALAAVEVATNCSLVKQISPDAYAELEWQRSHLASRLDEQRSRFARALVAPRPALSERLIETARERPALIPAMSKRVIKSYAYWGWWKGNVWLRRLKTRENFEATRAVLIEKWLQVRACLHRLLPPGGREHATLVLDPILSQRRSPKFEPERDLARRLFSTSTRASRLAVAPSSASLTLAPPCRHPMS